MNVIGCNEIDYSKEEKSINPGYGIVVLTHGRNSSEERVAGRIETNDVLKRVSQGYGSYKPKDYHVSIFDRMLREVSIGEDFTLNGRGYGRPTVSTEPGLSIEPR